MTTAPSPVKRFLSHLPMTMILVGVIFSLALNLSSTWRTAVWWVKVLGLASGALYGPWFVAFGYRNGRDAERRELAPVRASLDKALSELQVEMIRSKAIAQETQLEQNLTHWGNLEPELREKWSYN